MLPPSESNTLIASAFSVLTYTSSPASSTRPRSRMTLSNAGTVADAVTASTKNSHHSLFVTPASLERKILIVPAVVATVALIII